MHGRLETLEFFFWGDNEYYAMSEYTPVTATNPCGEEPLPPFGSCNLGSLDISKLVEKIDLGNPTSSTGEEFKEIVYWAVRFLDDVVEANVFPLKEIEEITRRQRFVGLGIMGLADALYKKKFRIIQKMEENLWQKLQHN